MKIINKRKLLFSILLLSMCFQNIEIMNFGTFGLKLFHVIGVLYLPWLLSKKKIKLPTRTITLFYIFMLFISCINFVKYGFHSLIFNYTFSFYIILLILNCGSDIKKEEWIDIIKKVAVIVLICVYINAIMNADIIIRFLKNPNGHPIYKFIFGGGANLEATWIGMFGFFFKEDKRGFLYTALCVIISTLLASRVGIIINCICFIFLTLQQKEARPGKIKKVRILIMLILGVILLIFLVVTGIVDYLLIRLKSIGTDTGSTARLLMWKNIEEAFKRNPLGYGVR